ncbi:transcription factor IBH1-like [Salvia hispanica]|uniref:transcription factor IBH1-like n=1 Tax=Salvia hispanica TaxID=49212 RepID=UPI0020095FCA|nr:transcription factor IBH1-like [Salvia hispanica]
MNIQQSAIKIRFAVKFVQAMKRLNKRRGMTMSMSTRYRATRAAACASMASAVGPQRAWSRAVLRKTKRRRFQAISKKRRLINPRREKLQEEDLRGLVPGGKGMEYCSLLSETAHYIKCLQAQIQVMSDILNHHSSSLN